MLGALLPSVWIDLDELAQAHPRAVLDALLDKQLLIAEASDAALRDQKLRDTHWRTPSAVMHYASRWTDVDTEGLQKDFADMIGGRMIDRLGPAPPVVRERVLGCATFAPAEKKRNLAARCVARWPCHLPQFSLTPRAS